jgi:hypothetical protein
MNRTSNGRKSSRGGIVGSTLDLQLIGVIGCGPLLEEVEETHGR